MTGHHMLKQRWYTKTIFSATAAATCFLLGSIFLVKRNQFNLSLLLNNDLATVDGGLLPPLIFPPKSTFAINSAPLPIALFRSLKSFHCELAWPSHDAWKDIPPESFWGFVFFFFRGKTRCCYTPWGGGEGQPKTLLDHHCVLQELKIFSLGSVPESEDLTRRVQDCWEGCWGERLVGWMDDLKGWGMRRVLGMGLSRSKLRDVFIWWAESVP